MTVVKTAFIIGAQRSGTTYLYNILDSHPDLYMAKPFKPEPKFFLNKENISKGREFYLNKFYNLRKEGQVLVEKSTSYIESVYAAKQIKTLFPDGKIIVSLRNPVERAISNYFFSKNNGLETRTLEEVFLKKKPAKSFRTNTSVSPFSYLERGEYVRYLHEYYKIFERDNIGVFIFEEFINNKENLNKVLRYIGVRDFEILKENFSKRINFSIKEKVALEVRNKIEEHYIPFNKELESLLGRDLEIWNK